MWLWSLFSWVLKIRFFYVGQFLLFSCYTFSAQQRPLGRQALCFEVDVLYAQRLVLVITKENIIIGPLWGKSVGSPHVLWKGFPFYYVQVLLSSLYRCFFRQVLPPPRPSLLPYQPPLVPRQRFLPLVSQSTHPHDDVIKLKHFPPYWPFARGIHRWPVNSPHKGQWRWAMMFSLICAWINGRVNNREAGDLGRHRPHYDFSVMQQSSNQWKFQCRHLYVSKPNHHWLKWWLVACSVPNHCIN